MFKGGKKIDYITMKKILGGKIALKGGPRSRPT